MKKLIAAVLAVITVFMTACGNTPAETTANTTAETTAEATEATTAETTAEATKATTAETTAKATEATTAETTAEATEATTAKATEATTAETVAETTAATEAETTEEVSIDMSSKNPCNWDYIVSDDVIAEMVEKADYNTGNRVRIKKVIEKASRGEEVKIAFIGGSITQGTSAGPDYCYARLTADWFETMFPSASITYVNAGIGATGSYIGVHRVVDDVLSDNPDLVFVEFSVNDTTENTERNKNSYDSLLRKIWTSDSDTAIICIGMTQENGTSFLNYHGEIAKFYDLPMISYKDAMLGIIKEGIVKWDDISDDDIHPNLAGHTILAGLITNYLQNAILQFDQISGVESDFSKAFTDDVYKDATMMRYGNANVVSEGVFASTDAMFGGLPGLWKAVAKNGVWEDGSSLIFEVTAKNIGLLFGKLTAAGGIINVKVDGESKKVINTAFPNGWGNYVECAEIVSFDEAGTHTVEIEPVSVDSGERQSVIISCLALS